MIGRIREFIYRISAFLFGPDEFKDVRAFHRKFGLLHSRTPGHLTKRKLNERIDCMYEELLEFRKAVSTQNLAEQADALVDLVYFAKGTAVMLGLPWEDLWMEVQCANMRKVPGVTKRGHAVDVTKPPGWQPPQIELILQARGYDFFEWTNVSNPDNPYFEPGVDERKCRDDEY